MAKRAKAGKREEPRTASRGPDGRFLPPKSAKAPAKVKRGSGSGKAPPASRKQGKR